jgi:putative transposase
MDRSSYRYEPQSVDDAQLRQDLIELARQKPRFGYPRLGALPERFEIQFIERDRIRFAEIG